ncbi:hypothetical protein CCAX7_58660 [Capsulimonas corticalis]|uniref:Uncharacterized protein n=1 Tax=Capsulimonas corticalis TaxID=2219043 RepID=A0A402CZY1_9BACT|nr:glycosyltransferase family 4 protein [Capsulimonas corticalis]BDI33815.1 hypothetical protein CCAX7_58660 [Capsulimonas corticalis]
MRHRVSVLLETLDLFDPELSNLPLHGANLATVDLLRRIASHNRVEALEVFLAPAAMARADQMALAAQQVLPPALRGQGRLSFYPMHALRDIWADGKPRIHWCMDPSWMARDRYLRDRFAAGPTPIACDTHGYGHHTLWGPLARFAAAPPVAFDSMLSLSTMALKALERIFSDFLSAPGARPPCRLDLVPRGVDPDLFHPHDAAEKDAARRALDLPPGARIALYAGRVTAHGKADLLPLIRAFAAAAGPDDILLIAGTEYPAGYGAKLLEFGKSLGLGERLIVHPRVEPSMRPRYYGASDIFVFPGDTVQETLGITMLEAMASGLPCIVSEWDGMRDLIRDGETGFTIPTWWMPGLDAMDAFSPIIPQSSEYLLTAQRVWVDTERLSSALATLLSSPETRAAMGAAGREWIESDFALPKIMDRWIDLWDELAETAASESDADRILRRSYADRLGHPTPYDRLFSHYAAATLDDRRDSVRLTQHGRSVAARAQPLELYEETLSLAQPAILDAIMDRLTQTGNEWMKLGAAIAGAAAMTGQPPDKVRFHLCLLLKRDVLQLRRDE